MKTIIQIVGVTFLLAGVLFGTGPAAVKGAPIPLQSDGVRSVEISLLGLGPRTATVSMKKSLEMQ